MPRRCAPHIHCAPWPTSMACAALLYRHDGSAISPRMLLAMKMPSPPHVLTIEEGTIAPSRISRRRFLQRKSKQPILPSHTQRCKAQHSRYTAALASLMVAVISGYVTTANFMHPMDSSLPSSAATTSPLTSCARARPQQQLISSSSSTTLYSSFTMRALPWRHMDHDWC